MKQNIFSTTVDAKALHRLMGHCCPRAMKQLLPHKRTTGVKLKRNVGVRDCEVCEVLKNNQSAQALSDRLRSSTRLAFFHVYTGLKHPV